MTLSVDVDEEIMWVLYTSCTFVTDKYIFVYLATTHHEQHIILIKEYEQDRIPCLPLPLFMYCLYKYEYINDSFSYRQMSITVFTDVDHFMCILQYSGF